MDIAKQFKPDTILLWKKISDDPQAQQIIRMFGDSSVSLIDNQKITPHNKISPAQAVIKGKKTLMLGHTSSFVGFYDGCPDSFADYTCKNKNTFSNVHCFPYYKLVPLSNGCPYYCTYCYLAYVYRKFSPFIKINVNYETMFKQIRKPLKASQGSVCFNMGEMLDSLALDHITNLTKILVPFFADFKNAYLMLLTKSNNIDNLISIEPNKQTIVSWSLNTQKMIDSFEPGTANLDERINSASLCQKHGYQIRFRIDPGIIYPGWQDDYADIIKKVISKTVPQNITLGMLRLLPGHFSLIKQSYGNRGRSLCDFPLTVPASDGKLRFQPDLRIQFYAFLIDTFRSFDKNLSIGLCRETPDVCSALKNRFNLNQCNCIVW